MAGLLDIFSSKSTSIVEYTPYSEVEALFNLLHLCTKADGESGKAEQYNLVNVIQNKKIFQYMGDIEELYINAESVIGKYGTKAVVDGCVKKLSIDFHKTVFTLCADIILADGIITEQEAKLLAVIGEQLSVDSEFAQKVAEVLLIKNKGNV